MYDKIKSIAINLWDNDVRISFAELAKRLGFYGRIAPRRAGQMAQKAWNFFASRGDSLTCSAISRSFYKKGRR